MKYDSHWLHEHHWGSVSFRQHLERLVAFLKSVWLWVLLGVLGVVAFVTAVILAYPVAAHIAAKFFQ